MWKCQYGDEPLDFKLLWLCFMKKSWILIAAILAGILLLGGGYFACSVLLAPQKEYQAVGETYIEYMWEDAYGISRVYLNESVWAALVKTDVFVDDMQKQLEETGVTVDREFLRDSVEASLVSDSRIVTTTVTTTDPALSVAISQALQNAVIHYGETQQGIEGTRILTTPRSASQVMLDNRTLQAAVLGGVLGGLLALGGMLFYFTADDSIHVPETFEHRYGIPMLGTLSSRELSANLQYLCRDCTQVAVTAVEGDIPTEEIAAALTAKPEGQEESQKPSSFVACDCALEDPGQAALLRASDGVILVVAAGRHDGKRIEKTLDFLKKQDCKVVAAIFWQADEKLLGQYYGFGMTGKKRV